MRPRLALTVIAALAFLVSQQIVAPGQQHKAKQGHHKPSVKAPDGSSAAATGCDDTLWQHVYHPTRLKKQEPCVTVTGTIVDATASQKTHHTDGIRHEADGDTHGWLKLDPQFTKLLNPGNTANEGGNMVFEVVCKYPINAAKEPAAVTACRGYHSSIQIPPVGSHVAITGTYVQDMNHGQWMEIHPVTSIVVQ